MIPSFIAHIASIMASLLGISFVIVFHEFGHFIFCKIFHVYTPTFSIGIGHVLVSKKIGDTHFAISAGPIGGYVEVATEKGPDGSLGFNQIPYYQKVLIMLGGIACNFILAYLFFIALFWTGMPENAAGSYEPCTNIVQSIPENSINKSTLQVGDQFVSIDNTPVCTDLSVARKIVMLSAPTISSMPAQVIRNGETIETTINLHGPKTSLAFSRQLDVSCQLKPSLSLRQSCKQAYIATIFYTKTVIHGLKSMVHNKSTKGFVGPVMAVAASSKSAQKGFGSLIFFLAIISINLGFMNLLPLPIFDGGQFVIFTIEAITRRQLSERVRHWIGISSWVLMIGLLVLFTIQDLKTLIFG
ncbi:site-2 protease family protein [Candidatus Babeliales bacterium]|nr:site-2 protease family protein [Candidatus Babeliales bacterium]